jgi:hypothetical protein
LKEHLKDTLLDGEMVIDHHEGKPIPRYLIYDIIKFRGKSFLRNQVADLIPYTDAAEIEDGGVRKPVAPPPPPLPPSLQPKPLIHFG